MLRENDHSAETGRNIPNEASIDGEPFNVALISAVEEDRAQSVGTHPVLSVYEVPLGETWEVREAEVVELLVEVSGLISVLLELVGFDRV